MKEILTLDLLYEYYHQTTVQIKMVKIKMTQVIIKYYLQLLLWKDFIYHTTFTPNITSVVTGSLISVNHSYPCQRQCKK